MDCRVQHIDLYRLDKPGDLALLPLQQMFKQGQQHDQQYRVSPLASYYVVPFADYLSHNDVV